MSGYEFHAPTPPPVDYMADAMKAWVEDGIPPGSFGYALLSNDLRGAVEHADENNLQNLPAWVHWCVHSIPAICWGSPAAVERWEGAGGMRGRRAAEAREANLRG